MTTKEIKKNIAKLTEEVNKVKSYATKLSKKLVENNIEVPVPNWSDLVTEDNN